MGAVALAAGPMRRGARRKRFAATFLPRPRGGVFSRRFIFYDFIGSDEYQG
jgi:hypothetical protein